MPADPRRSEAPPAVAASGSTRPGRSPPAPLVSRSAPPPASRGSPASARPSFQSRRRYRHAALPGGGLAEHVAQPFARGAVGADAGRALGRDRRGGLADAGAAP